MRQVNVRARLGVTAACLLTAAGTALGASAPAQARTAPADAAAGDIPTFDFADCPEVPAGFDEIGSVCVEQVSSGGRIQIGRLSHEITDPITFTHAEFSSRATGERRQVVGALRANPVPVDSASLGLPPGLDVRATPEYAGPFSMRYPDVTIGVKIRLTGAGLGGSCLIGDDGDPILMNMTTGTTDPPPPNTPISGVPFEFLGSQGKAGVRKATHVDNAFPAPAARGCTRNGQNIDHLVNAAAGLPSPAGTNTVVLSQYFGHIGYINLP